VPNWPFAATEAARRQAAAGPATRAVVKLSDEVEMELVLIPAGEFVMGDPHGAADERPMCRVKIERPFWMGTCEVTNAQFQRFRPQHDSRYIDQQWKDHNTPGYPGNQPQQPVTRVTWHDAAAFCDWLSEKTGQTFSLPSEAEWEWACRAGTGTALWYGDRDADFAAVANLADVRLTGFAVRGVNPQPVPNPDPFIAFLPRIDAVDDGQMIAAAVGGYQANAWGLKDMHGNVAEWTRTAYRLYPYLVADGRDEPATRGKKVVRGGSWRDRPHRARSAARWAYEPHQPVFDAGFRVISPLPK
jgi:formylglycine-generating enzyme required for sulfatase activity